MTLVSFLILFAGGIVAGMINVLAGGAGFMTFPLLLAVGLTEMQANAANFVALIPANIVGTAVYRRELREVRQHLVIRLVLAAVGGALGSLLFVWLGADSFKTAIPWLLLFATASFGLGPLLKRWLERHQNFVVARWLWLSFLLEFAVYLYGGYFGLGMGIILLAIHSIFSHMTIHHAQALRNATITLMTLIGILDLCIAGHRALAAVVGHDGRCCRRWLWHGYDRPPPAAERGARRHSRLVHSANGVCVLALSLTRVSPVSVLLQCSICNGINHDQDHPPRDPH